MTTSETIEQHMPAGEYDMSDTPEQRYHAALSALHMACVTSNWSALGAISDDPDFPASIAHVARVIARLPLWHGLDEDVFWFYAGHLVDNHLKRAKA